MKRVSTPFNLTKRLKKEVRALAELDDTYRPHGKQRHYLGIRLKTRAELDGDDGEVIKMEEKKAEITVKVDETKVEEKKTAARGRFLRRF